MLILWMSHSWTFHHFRSNFFKNLNYLNSDAPCLLWPMGIEHDLPRSCKYDQIWLSGGIVFPPKGRYNYYIIVRTFLWKQTKFLPVFPHHSSLVSNDLLIFFFWFLKCPFMWQKSSEPLRAPKAMLIPLFDSYQDSLMGKSIFLGDVDTPTTPNHCNQVISEPIAALGVSLLQTIFLAGGAGARCKRTWRVQYTLSMI